MGNVNHITIMEVQPHVNHITMFGYIYIILIDIMAHNDVHVYYWYLDSFLNSNAVVVYHDYFLIYHSVINLLAIYSYMDFIVTVNELELTF